MKTIKNQMKSIALVLAVLVFLQSCKAYHAKPVSLERASNEFERAKVQTKNNEILKFKGIKFENNQYYGVKKVKGEIVNIPLDETYIKSVKLENKTLSTVLTIALPVAVIFGTLLLFQDAFEWHEINIDSLEWE